MLFLGAGASKRFGVNTLQEIEEKFGKTLEKVEPNEELFNGRFLYQGIKKYIEQPPNIEDILTVLNDLSKAPSHPTTRYLYFLLTRHFFDLYEKEVNSYEKLINDLLRNDDVFRNQLRISPKFLNNYVKLEINLREETFKIEDMDKPHGLENANAKELLEARRKELLKLKKYALDSKWILTNYNLAERLKSKIIEFIREECSIEKKIEHNFSIKRDIESKYDRLFEVLGKYTSPPFNIFTTNYDTIIETYIGTKGEFYEFYDGFTYRNSQRRNGDWNPEGYNENRYKIKLLKLHGSIDQYIGKEGIIKTPPEPHRHENAMIYPMREKEIYKDPFFELFTRLKTCLCSEKICVVIGYSFRDEHIKSIFFDAVKSNPGIRKIIVIDKDPDKVKKNLDRIGRKIETIKGEFGEESVFEYLEQILAELSEGD